MEPKAYIVVTILWLGWSVKQKQGAKIKKIGTPNLNELRRQEYYPWKRSPTECKDFSVRFGSLGEFPSRGSVGFPGSGNKWLRSLIVSATGYFVSSVIYPNRINDRATCMGYNMPPWDGTTILTRSHDAGYEITRPDKRISLPILKNRKEVKLEDVSEVLFNFRGILLIRNPWEAILSSFQHTNAQSYCKTIKTINSDEFVSFFKRASKAWKKLAERWIIRTPSTDDLLIIKFENLKNNTEKELERITRFLKLKISNSRIRCAATTSTKNCVRKPLPTEVRAQLEKTYLDNPNISKSLNKHIVSLNLMLKKRGFTTRLNYTRPIYNKLI